MSINTASLAHPIPFFLNSISEPRSDRKMGTFRVKCQSSEHWTPPQFSDVNCKQHHKKLVEEKELEIHNVWEKTITMTVFYSSFMSDYKQLIARFLCTENYLCMNNLAKDSPSTAALHHSLYFVVLNCLRSWTILGAFSQEAGKEANAIAGHNDG